MGHCRLGDVVVVVAAAIVLLVVLVDDGVASEDVVVVVVVHDDQALHHTGMEQTPSLDWSCQTAGGAAALAGWVVGDAARGLVLLV